MTCPLVLIAAIYVLVVPPLVLVRLVKIVNPDEAFMLLCIYGGVVVAPAAVLLGLAALLSR
tara:strand:- start:403 stop:585 length:183 start_codon:yes stop_codon:yes gene_type:complete